MIYTVVLERLRALPGEDAYRVEHVAASSFDSAMRIALERAEVTDLAETDVAAVLTGELRPCYVRREPSPRLRVVP